LHCGAKSMNII